MFEGFFYSKDLTLYNLVEGFLALLDDALLCKIRNTQGHLNVCHLFAVDGHAAALYELSSPRRWRLPVRT